MAYTLTYDGLVNQVQAYMERNDIALVDNIPVFIMLAQVRMSIEGKTLGIREFVTNQPGSPLSANNPVLTKPANWRTTESFYIGTGLNQNVRFPLQTVSYEVLRQYAPDDTYVSQPLYYSDYGFNNWIVGPTPDMDYPYEISYFQQITPIDSTNQTNWFTQNVPHILLFATLAEAIPFVKTDERLQIFEGKYQAAMQPYKIEDVERKVDAYNERALD